MKHIYHLEELIFQNKLDVALTFLRKLGSDPHNISISSKIDGSPSVFFGYIDSGFFVSTKSFLNKSPVYFTSTKQIEKADLDEPLKFKLIACYDTLKKMYTKGIYQGDLLHWGNLEQKTVGETEYHLMHPNTLVYGIDLNTKEADLCHKSKIGISVHTEYRYENGVLIPEQSSKHKSSKDVFILNHVLDTPDMFSIDIPDLKCTEIIPDNISKEVEIFNNSLIKNNMKHFDGMDSTNKFIDFLTERATIKANKLLTQKGKDNHFKKLEGDLITISKLNMPKLFDGYNALMEIKHKLIDQLSVSSKHSTFVKKNKEYHNTSGEGFVLRFNNTATKFVDRYEFSQNNFSNEVEKGWKKTK